MGPDDDSPIIVDQRDQFEYGAPPGNLAVFGVGEKHQEMPFGAGMFHASNDCKFWKPVLQFLDL
jgi:hypothetical protein